MALDVSRTQVLAYRAAAHGLARDTADAGDLEVLDLGIQDSSLVGTARLALTARLPDVPTGADDPVADEKTFALLWSFRGAPHLHRRADLPALTRALWPLSDADAMSRLAAARGAMKEAGIAGLAAFTAASKALRAVVTKPLAKGDVSAGVTAKLPAAYSYACRSCAATHVNGSIFQLAGLPAGVRHVPDRNPLTLTKLENRSAIPSAPSPDETTDVARAYLRLHGPATAAEVASYLGTTQAHVKPVWPDDLTEVKVDGRRCWIPTERLAALRGATAQDYVRLLPALDPFVQGRDRDLLVPDRGQQKELWKILGNPGALFVKGDLVGTWRGRSAGKKTLTVTVQPFGTLAKKIRASIEDEADRIGALRGLGDVRVSYEKA